MFRGWIRTSLIDFPDHIATVLFTGGCDFRCPMCHNASLVTQPGQMPAIPEDEIWRFLDHRKGLIDGIVLSGGEPTLCPALLPFMQQARAGGWRLKIDTNGYHPEVLDQLIAEDLLDYVALDVKAPPEKYGLLAGISDLDLNRIKRSMALIRESGIRHEFRTTVVPGLLDEDDITGIARWIEGAPLYALQQFRPPDALEARLRTQTPYPTSTLLRMAERASEWVASVTVRGD